MPSEKKNKSKTISISYPDEEELAEVELSFIIRKRREKDELKCMYAEDNGWYVDKDTPRYLSKKIVQAVRSQSDDFDGDGLVTSPADIFGMRIYALRQSANIAPKEFSKKAKITQAELFSIELGVTHADKLISYLSDLEDAFDNKLNITKLFFSLLFDTQKQ